MFDRELDMMLSPNKWPMYPDLPLKRHKPNDPQRRLEFGYLTYKPDYYRPGNYLLRLGLVFIPTASFINYRSLEDIVAAGWRVD